VLSEIHSFYSGLIFLVVPPIKRTIVILLGLHRICCTNLSATYVRPSTYCLTLRKPGLS
jgi:hypothetical protein